MKFTRTVVLLGLLGLIACEHTERSPALGLAKGAEQLADRCDGDHDAQPGGGEVVVVEPSFFVATDKLGPDDDLVAPIMAAARVQLVPLCREEPERTVRVYDPRAPDVYTELSCTSVLADDATGEANASLITNEGDGPIGEVLQPLSPFSLVCGIFFGTVALVANYALCPRARTPRDERRCGYVVNGGFFGIGIACAFI